MPADFHRQPHASPLDVDHRVKVGVTAAIDHVLRTGLATAVCGAMLPNFGPRGLRREQAMFPFYQALASAGRREDIFLTPPRGTPIRALQRRVPALNEIGATVHDLRFESPYQALHPDVRVDYASHHRNLTAHAQHWTHGDRPRRTLIFVHGYSLDAYWVNTQMFSLKGFFRQGWDILLFTLPFHGRRKAPLEPFSGFGYFSRGFAQTTEAMLQSIFELRLLMTHLEDTGVPGMGISGLSLGGYLSALLAGVDDRLAFAIPNAAVVSPADMVLEWPPLSFLLAPLMPLTGLGIQGLRHVMAVHSPLTWKPVIDPERLLIIAGAGDRFTAPRYQTLLHTHWRGSRLHWFPGNHVVHLHQREYLRLMRDFMNRWLPEA